MNGKLASFIFQEFSYVCLYRRVSEYRFSYTQSTITKTCRSTNTNISLLFVLLSATNTNKHTEGSEIFVFALELDKSLHQLRTAMRDNYRRVSYHELVLWKFVTSQWLDGDHCICIIGGSRGGVSGARPLRVQILSF